MPYAGPLKLKAQLFCGGERAMGPGKADLLEAIDREGSISAAGRALGMSYRYTWLMVDSMNRCFTDKLVATLPGGGHARGAALTDTGRAVLAAFRGIEASLLAAAQAGPDFAAMLAVLRPEPLPPARTTATEPTDR